MKEYTGIQKPSTRKKGAPTTRKDPNYIQNHLKDRYKVPSKSKPTEKHETEQETDCVIS